MDKNKDTERIFKDSTEDADFYEDYKRKNPYEKEKQRRKIISISIVGAVLAITYFIVFFTKVYPLINDQYAKVKESKDNISYTLKRVGYTEVIEINGRPNQTNEAFIYGEFNNGRQINYRITFSNPNDWENSYITLYNQFDSIIYENQYEDSHIIINPENFMNDENFRVQIYNGNYIPTLEDLSVQQIVSLALRSGVRFRGNVISLFFIAILIVALLYSIFFWEKSFERWMRWNTNNFSNVGPSDFYEFRVRIGQLMIVVFIIIELFRAFTY